VALQTGYVLASVLSSTAAKGFHLFAALSSVYEALSSVYEALSY
jgi:hypothetical protein